MASIFIAMGIFATPGTSELKRPTGSAKAHLALFPEGSTTDGTVLKPFYRALAQAAIDAGAMVEPVAIKYRSIEGSPKVAAAFVDPQSLVNALGLVIDQAAIRAELIFGEPFSVRAVTRGEVIRRSRHFIAHALGLPHFDTKLDPSALMRYSSLRSSAPGI